MSLRNGRKYRYLHNQLALEISNRKDLLAWVDQLCTIMRPKPPWWVN